MPELISIPLDGGFDESIDAKLVPEGLLRVAENVVLRREGQLEVRPTDVALSLTTYNNHSLIAYDSFNFNERLFVIGDDNGFGFPSDIYEYVNEAQAWRNSADGVIRLPFATDVRDVGTPTDQDGDVVGATCAAYDDVVIMAYQAANNSFGWAHIFQASTDSTLIFHNFSAVAGSDASCNFRCLVTTAGNFWFIGQNSALTAVGGYAYTPATDETLPATDTNLVGGGVTITAFDCAEVTGGAGGFVVTVSRGGLGTIDIFKFNNAGVQQGATIVGPAISATHISIQADSSSNRMVIAYRDSLTGIYHAASYNFSAGTLIDSDALYSSATGPGPISVTQKSATQFYVAAWVTSTATDQTICATIDYATITNQATAQIRDGRIASKMLAPHADAPVCAYVLPDGRTGNYLQAISQEMQLVAKDFENSSILTNEPLASFTRDTITGKYYWANVFKNNDGENGVQITEFNLFSTERRQASQIGNLYYLSGGLPTVFDGRMLVEQGFTERPRVVGSITSSDSVGALTNGGFYSYTSTWEWLDTDRNLHQSPPSRISTIQLGATHDTVDYPISTPHSLRCNTTAKNVYGSTVRAILWRNTCSVELIAATFLTAPVTPPVSSLNLKDLLISVDSGSYQLVLFGAGDTTATAIAGTINAATTGLTAVVVGATVRITSDTTGPASRLFVTGASIDILGLRNPNGSGFDVFGSTTVTPGQNFQRAASRTIGVTELYGDPLTVTDLMSDDDLRSQQVLYTQSQTPLAHHSPPPYKYSWSGGDRLTIGGLPRTSEWAVSKLLFNAEPIEFALVGRLGFGGRANGPITSVSIQDNIRYIFTNFNIQSVIGEGPDHTGQGEFFTPNDVSSDGGSMDWRPLIKTTEGLFFKLDAEPAPKLYMMSHGGMAAWVGFVVQDLIELYPNIIAAVHLKSHQHVCFACNDNAGHGIILRYDLRRKVWFTHTVASSLRGLTQINGRLVYVLSNGTVLRAEASPGTGAFVNYRIRTGSFGGFDHLGYGDLYKVGIMGQVMDDCALEARISYDDGSNFKTMDAFTLAGTDSLNKFWTPEYSAAMRFVLEFVVTGSADSRGCRLNKILLEVEKREGPARLGAADLK